MLPVFPLSLRISSLSDEQSRLTKLDINAWVLQQLSIRCMYSKILPQKLSFCLEQSRTAYSLLSLILYKYKKNYAIAALYFQLFLKNLNALNYFYMLNEHSNWFLRLYFSASHWTLSTDCAGLLWLLLTTPHWQSSVSYLCHPHSTCHQSSNLPYTEEESHPYALMDDSVRKAPSGVTWPPKSQWFLFFLPRKDYQWNWWRHSLVVLRDPRLTYADVTVVTNVDWKPAPAMGSKQCTPLHHGNRSRSQDKVVVALIKKKTRKRSFPHI